MKQRIKNIFSIGRNVTGLSLALLACSTILMTSSCSKHDPNSPGVEYMPDMYISPDYETNSYNPFFADSMSDRVPVEGTIPRGFQPDPYPNTPQGWLDAAKNLEDPFPADTATQAEGKQIFLIYCRHCHGDQGMGDGPVAMKLPGPPPPYSGPALKNITVGEMYQTLEYGKGLMGSHASQMTVEERWKVIRYVQVLQKLGSDTTKTATASVAKDSTAAK